MLGSGMLIVGTWFTFVLADRALQAGANPIAARCGQVVAAVAVLLFLYPYLRPFFDRGGG